MKRLIPILLAVFAFAACEKDPDMDKLDNDYLVYTNYDKKADELKTIMKEAHTEDPNWPLFR